MFPVMLFLNKFLCNCLINVTLRICTRFITLISRVQVIVAIWISVDRFTHRRNTSFSMESGKHFKTKQRRRPFVLEIIFLERVYCYFQLLKKMKTSIFEITFYKVSILVVFEISDGDEKVWKAAALYFYTGDFTSF